MTSISRYWSKRIRRHIVLALVSGLIMLGIYYLPVLTLGAWQRVSSQSNVTMFRLSMASAYAALVFLCASLVIGPWNVLRGRPRLVSTDLRRDVGIWAGLLGLAHVVVGLQVHAGWKIWLNFFYWSNRLQLPLPLHDLFGLANYVGLGVALVLMVLLLLSNNFSLRILGTRRWKALQRWNYVGFALVVVHGVAYQFIENRYFPFVVLLGGMVLVVVVMQLMGIERMQRMRSTTRMKQKNCQWKLVNTHKSK